MQVNLLLIATFYWRVLKVFSRRFLFALFVVLNTMSLAVSQEIVDEEARVKATYILSFIQYTTWSGLENEGGHLTEMINVCSMRGEPFLGFMMEVLEEKKVRVPEYESVTIELIEYSSIHDCEVLFVPSEASSSFQLAEYSRDNLLLIGESPGFATSGGMINFYIENDSVRFEINYDEMRTRKLSMNAQVLRLARIVP